MKIAFAGFAILLMSASFSLPSSASNLSFSPKDHPPTGISIEKAPLFVMFGFDDNPNTNDMKWIVDFMDKLTNPAGSSQTATYDGSPVRAAFYTNGKFVDKTTELRQLHLEAYHQGHEIANHTQNHHHGGKFSTAQWLKEIETCQQALIECGIPADAITGFRTPFLEFNASTFEAVEQLGFRYDSSIEEGYQPNQDGTNFLWPYKLTNGSPGLSHYREEANTGNHPNLWQVPIHLLMIPPQELCDTYGLDPKIRQTIQRNFAKAGYETWSAQDGKVTGFDWNILEMAKLSGDDYLSILKYNLDLRLKGNRAPMMVGVHTALFPSSKPDRRNAIEAFINYALTHADVRIVTPNQLLDWMESPIELE